MSNISESIREAALSWPRGVLGPVESCILNFGFLPPGPDLYHEFCHDETIARTFMLLVAEALE